MAKLWFPACDVTWVVWCVAKCVVVRGGWLVREPQDRHGVQLQLWVGVCVCVHACMHGAAGCLGVHTRCMVPLGAL